MTFLQYCEDQQRQLDAEKANALKNTSHQPRVLDISSMTFEQYSVEQQRQAQVEQNRLQAETQLSRRVQIEASIIALDAIKKELPKEIMKMLSKQQ